MQVFAFKCTGMCEYSRSMCTHYYCNADIYHEDMIMIAHFLEIRIITMLFLYVYEQYCLELW